MNLQLSFPPREATSEAIQRPPRLPASGSSRDIIGFFRPTTASVARPITDRTVRLFGRESSWVSNSRLFQVVRGSPRARDSGCACNQDPSQGPFKMKCDSGISNFRSALGTADNHSRSHWKGCLERVAAHNGSNRRLTVRGSSSVLATPFKPSFGTLFEPPPTVLITLRLDTP
uniref:Uncharacterized protein n=1 Tax=Mycena chlorophos TaxID=658473 RepID=A0ABQ0LQ02_MYCCL|nr:predicted protein [Mycena chlorophos]